MKIAVHIPFYNPSPERKEKPLNRNKIFKKKDLQFDHLNIRQMFIFIRIMIILITKI